MNDVKETIRRTQAFRESGRVERFHVIPHHNAYPIGLHCWTMLTLLFALFPDSSRELIWAIVFHDLGERWTGDLPSPAKKDALVKERLDRIEGYIDDQMGTGFTLTPAEQDILLGLDYLDCWLFCVDEMNMGNGHMYNAATGIRKSLTAEWVPDPIRHFINNYVWERTSEHGPNGRLG